MKKNSARNLVVLELEILPEKFLPQSGLLSIADLSTKSIADFGEDI